MQGVPDARISVHRGDITTLRVDAIVTAANTELAGCRKAGHCVDAAVFGVAGERLFDACRSLGGCPTGQVKITRGFNLPARAVIHAVGPVWAQHTLEDNMKHLFSCYYDSLTTANRSGLRSVAFCCISRGLYGAPARPACAIAIQAVRTWLKHNRDVDMRVIFCVYTTEDEDVYRLFTRTG